ncbi:MAG: selenide, water dikinase SelD [Eubacteriales bacterium]
MEKEKVNLTEYSHGAGCGCKISPAILDAILKTSEDAFPYPNLLVGNQSKDDAAAYDLGNGTAILSTTDFFMPIVDDPFTFGKIAATNALSDIYAMGGKPLMAIAILGWPIKILSPVIAREVINGGRAACQEAGIPLAGGHSIDSPEPIFGLAVTGIINNKNIKQNNKATKGCEIFLTKPLGIGILTTAQKRKKIKPNHLNLAIDAMCTLNSIGATLSTIEGVKALTDVTGFGLLGHLSEICEGSDITAIINYNHIPLLPHIKEYIKMNCIPGGTENNFNSYGHKIGSLTEEQKTILCDPQTSGGLLALVEKESIPEFLQTTSKAGLSLTSIGHTCEYHEKLIHVIE